MGLAGFAELLRCFVAPGFELLGDEDTAMLWQHCDGVRTGALADARRLGDLW